MFTIELYLEQAAAEQVRRWWQRLAEHGIGSLLQSNSRPHVTLGAFEEIDAGLADVLERFFERMKPSSVRFDVLGCFPATNVLHLTPTVTQALLKLHDEFHQAVETVVAKPLAYYLPGRWVPHCTLAIVEERKQLVEAFAMLSQEWQPLHTSFTAVALMRPSPVAVELWQRSL